MDEIEKKVHTTVLSQESLEYLDVKEGRNFIDATLDGASFAEAVLAHNSPNGTLLGIEWDSVMYNEAVEKLSQFSERTTLVNESYTSLEKIVSQTKIKKYHGIIFDFGVSSFHFERSGRGFTFQKDEKLDMRFNPETQSLTATEILNRYSENELAEIFLNYGQERLARKIARLIVEARREKKIISTLQLASLVQKAYGRFAHKAKRNPSTKVFQALRIEVNKEIENIKNVLPQTFLVLEPKGRIVCITFHSLEDKIVKDFFKEQQKAGKIKILTKKPLTPSPLELKNNPRARSAKLRAAEIL